ncbi:hypothetical protein ZIOFF_011419 [Zingiber officinale]|uniref:C2 domain-containing protein n=1 Tax=Zingiber officinale TaxID=94328 RepID=A0A8J5HR18_ZINOF|nr:hypothetical protein ZIOFF_011419 [Zingiber officinale]
MVQGTLHVLLVSAKGLDDADFLGNMDPYAILTCRSQEQKSSIASACPLVSSYLRLGSLGVGYSIGCDVRQCATLLNDIEMGSFVLEYGRSNKETNFLCWYDNPIVDTGAGNEPEWNETFVFTVSDSTTDLIIKLFDKDTFSSDDFVGETKILLDTVFAEGNLPPTVYNVVKDQEYRGEIKVGLTFTPSEDRSLDFGEEEFGGWKQSSRE